MTDLVPHEPWGRITGESAAQHAWLIAYIELGEQRSVEAAARRCGVPVRTVREAASKHSWEGRAAAYDRAAGEVAQALMIDESEALAAQAAAGKIMLRLGISALALKNPTLIKTKDATALVKEGAEAVRRGAGVADMTVTHETTAKVEQMLDHLFGDS